MVKRIWNPLDPKMSHKQYERAVGDCIEWRLEHNPDEVISYFESLVDDPGKLQSLTGLRWSRRTPQKPKWQGASGYEHQIDESFSTKDEQGIMLVECKHWAKCIDIPAFSTFLARIIDIAKRECNSFVLGMLVTTQGPQGKSGGREEDRDCIEKLRPSFGRMGYPISIQQVTDANLRKSLLEIATSGHAIAETEPWDGTN